CYLNNYGQEYCDYSPWHDWVRWVVLVVIVVAFLLVFILCSCLTARRRRRMGQQPYWGTGWAARNGHGEAQFVGNQNYHPPPNAPGYNAQPYYNPQYSQPAPPYTPPANGYYGQQQTGFEMGTVPNQPPPAHTGPERAADDVYAPPPGPPPQKGERII
ncbi:uncharacterized protein K452DRAFT_217778, partial [Aplosporella prunicola CBS 121167]